MPTAKLQRHPAATPEIALREVPTTQLSSIYPLIETLNPKLTKREFTKRLKVMIPLGYRAIAAYDGKRMVGLSGFWIGMRFWCGRQLDVDNFVVDPHYRGQQIGEKLLVWLEKEALRHGCHLMVLDVYTDNYLAHRFYHRAGFVATGYHFTKIPGTTKPYQKTS
jgi:ribosomal protein S18 acetylase RimI-like enzyme